MIFYINGIYLNLTMSQNSNTSLKLLINPYEFFFEEPN